MYIHNNCFLQLLPYKNITYTFYPYFFMIKYYYIIQQLNVNFSINKSNEYTKIYEVTYGITKLY